MNYKYFTIKDAPLWAYKCFIFGCKIVDLLIIDNKLCFYAYKPGNKAIAFRVFFDETTGTNDIEIYYGFHHPICAEFY